MHNEIHQKDLLMQCLMPLSTCAFLLVCVGVGPTSTCKVASESKSVPYII